MALVPLAMEQGRGRRRRFGGVRMPDRRARHPREDAVDAAVGAGHGQAGETSRLAGTPVRRGGLRRDDQRDRFLRIGVERGHRGLAGTRQVARPPADLGEVDEAGPVERTQTRERLELGARERQRTEPQVCPGQRQVDATRSSVVRARVDPRLEDGARHAGSRR
jgi:hypothetical protein